MTNKGSKFLQKELDDAHKQYGASIEHLKGTNLVLGRERDSYKKEILSIANGKFFPCFKRFIELRKEYKSKVR